jgi:sulfite reductase (NADPH) flavoprotein alpha-component
MVGPGTGLAPFRSFIQQRLLQRQQQVQQHPDTPRAELGAMHLFFGCRRRDQDFIYGQQLQAWHDEGAITLHTAFSRENASKVYVQQRLREASNVVWQLLQDGAHFYVCGDAGCMAGAVETALLEIIAQHQHAVVAGCEAGSILTANDVEPAAGVAAGAQSYLQRLVVEGRYQRDVWLS